MTIMMMTNRSCFCLVWFGECRSSTNRLEARLMAGKCNSRHSARAVFARCKSKAILRVESSVILAPIGSLSDFRPTAADFKGAFPSRRQWKSPSSRTKVILMV